LKSPYCIMVFVGPHGIGKGLMKEIIAEFAYGSNSIHSVVLSHQTAESLRWNLLQMQNRKQIVVLRGSECGLSDELVIFLDQVLRGQADQLDFSDTIFILDVVGTDEDLHPSLTWLRDEHMVHFRALTKIQLERVFTPKLLELFKKTFPNTDIPLSNVREAVERTIKERYEQVQMGVDEGEEEFVENMIHNEDMKKYLYDLTISIHVNAAPKPQPRRVDSDAGPSSSSDVHASSGQKRKEPPSTITGKVKLSKSSGNTVIQNILGKQKAPIINQPAHVQSQDAGKSQLPEWAKKFHTVGLKLYDTNDLPDSFRFYVHPSEVPIQSAKLRF